MSHLQVFEHEFVFPAKNPPAWTENVDRWYQMDAFAFGACDAFSRFETALGRLPDFVFLASREASNRTDRLFVEGGSISPSKFVHTLPNVRSAPLFQIAGWSGPCLCLQNDPATEIAGLVEAAMIVSAEFETVWMFSIEPMTLSYRARVYVLSDSKTADFMIRKIQKTSAKPTENSSFDSPTDEHWLHWLRSAENTLENHEKFHLSNSLQVIRCGPDDRPKKKPEERT